MPEAKVTDLDDWKCRFCCRPLASGAAWADMTPGVALGAGGPMTPRVALGAGGPTAWSTQVRETEKEVVSRGLGTLQRPLARVPRVQGSPPPPPPPQHCTYLGQEGHYTLNCVPPN